MISDKAAEECSSAAPPSRMIIVGQQASRGETFLSRTTIFTTIYYLQCE